MSTPDEQGTTGQPTDPEGPGQDGPPAPGAAPVLPAWEKPFRDTMAKLSTWPDFYGKAEGLSIYTDPQPPNAWMLRAEQGPHLLDRPTTLLPYDGKSLYRVAVKVRVLTPPAAANKTYLGFNGMAADKTTRVNPGGTDTASPAHWVALASGAVGTDFTTYLGFVRGWADAGTRTAATDYRKPGVMHKDTRYLHPTCYLLNGSGGDGLADVDDVQIWVSPSLAMDGVCDIGPDRDQFPVTLRTACLWNTPDDYEGYEVFRDGQPVKTGNGALPATITDPAMTQAAGSTVTWAVRLWNTSKPDADRVETTLTAPVPDGPVLLRTADGSKYLWCEVQTWGERKSPRANSVLSIVGSPSPVVVSDIFQFAASTVTFLTRTLAQLAALKAFLSNTGRLRLDVQPEYPGVESVSFVALSLAERRLSNNGADTRRLVDVDVQETWR